MTPPRARADSGDPVKPFLPQILVSSTIPANGDLNPHGVALVPPGFPAGGPLIPGDVLVSNFNNSGNLQGAMGVSGEPARISSRCAIITNWVPLRG
jgi:hypothetical protein